MSLRYRSILQMGTASVPYTNTQAIKFDSDSEYVNCGVLSGLNAVTEFSHSFWVKYNSSASDQYFMGSYTDPSNSIYYRLRPSIETFQLYMDSGGFNCNIAFSDIAVPVDTWAHILVSFNGAGSTTQERPQVYVNGVASVYSLGGAVGPVMPTLTSNMEIGKVGGLAQYGANITIDEVGFFAEYIPAGNVAEVYNGGSPNDLMTLPSIGQPLHYYRFEDGSVATLIDSGTGGANATTVNMEDSDLVSDVP